MQNDIYKYFDCTLQCEFIYKCVKLTLDKTFPQELNYLKNFDSRGGIKGYLNDYLKYQFKDKKNIVALINKINNKL